MSLQRMGTFLGTVALVMALGAVDTGWALQSEKEIEERARRIEERAREIEKQAKQPEQPKE